MRTKRLATPLGFRVLSLTMLLLLLAACARGGQSPDPGPTDSPQEPAEEVPWVVPPSLVDLGLHDGVDAIIHQQFEPYEVVEKQGIYLLDTATGRLDYWALEHADFAQYGISEDNRWISAWDSQNHYLIDRHESTAVSWSADKKGALAAMADRALFAGEDRYVLTSDGLLKAAPLEGLTPPEGPGAHEVALFSRDARYLAIVTGMSLHVVETATGKLTALPEIAPDGPNRSVAQVFLDHSNQDDEFVLTVLSQGGNQEGSLLSYRYAWTGELHGQSRPPTLGVLSPDGSLVARWQVLGGVVPSVVVAEAATGEPLFRVRNITLCDNDLWQIEQPWLADSSGLVVDAGGQYRILTREGDLIDSPALAGQVGIFQEPQPAPDRPDLFAIGRTKVVDTTGRALAEAKLGENQSPGHFDPWGFTSDELRFVLPHLGHGARCGDYPDLGEGPVLEKPPFREEVVLRPELPEGECANLRYTPDLEAEVVTCVPGGSLLTVVANKSTGATTAFAAGEAWVHVRTESGQTGWVAAKSGNLRWVP